MSKFTVTGEMKEFSNCWIADPSIA